MEIHMKFLSKKIDKQLASYQQELIETHYQEVDNMYQQMRGWRHDYRNHIQTMKAYAASGDWDAIRHDIKKLNRILDLLDEDLTTVDTVIKTGNPMTDAILNSKISLAKSKNIPVVADAHIPLKLRSSELDLCCIIGNLFDNAIEASLKLPEKERMIAIGSTSLGRSIRFVSGAKISQSQSIAPEARNIPIAQSIAVRYGMIITAVENPSFAPVVNEVYTGTLLKIAYNATAATTSGIAQIEITSNTCVIFVFLLIPY